MKGFEHDVFCRRDINQHKARLAWKTIKGKIPHGDGVLFEIEWNHYLNNELDTNDFAFYFDKYVKTHLTIAAKGENNVGNL